MDDNPTISKIHFSPDLPLIEVKPRTLNSDERAILLHLLRRESADAAFDQFVTILERELGAYVIRRRQHREKATTPSQARNGCGDIAKAARKLRAAWNKAPAEALQFLDFAYQRQRYRDDPPKDGEKLRFVRSLTSIFSDVSTPFFMNFEASMDTLIKTSDLAATSTSKQAAGGRPLNPPLIFLVRSIAQGFVSILQQAPKTTRIGPFSQTVHWALDLVSDDDKITSVPKHIERAVEEIEEDLDT